MPVIKPAVLSRCEDFLRLFSVRSLISTFSLRLTSSQRAAVSSGRYPKEPYLETQILNGADGDGRFMSTIGNKTGTQRSWLSRITLGGWAADQSHQPLSSTDATAWTDTHHNNHHQISDEVILMTTRVSSESHGIIQDEELHRDDTLQGQKIRDSV